jgi:3-hydroxyisobutyrate dehydrogenase-like beta-hydroxyacid dehydrogenase
MSETIGFIGLGKMGLPMAKNLLAAGYALKVYNRTAGKAQALAGAKAVATPAETATRGGIVVSMLSDDAAVEAAAGGELIEALAPNGIHVSMSTVSPDTNARLEERGRKHGVHVVAAPVFGRPEAAAAKKLWICTSGDTAAAQRVRPVLNALGQGIFDFGEKVGAANVVKLMGNFLIMASIEAMAEAATVGEKYGIPRQDLLAMFTATLFNCPIYTLYSKKIVDADFDKVGFKAELALKDMRLGREVAVAGRAPTPTIDLLCERFLTAIANGRGDLDASSLAGEVARQAGLHWQK